MPGKAWKVNSESKAIINSLFIIVIRILAFPQSLTIASKARIQVNPCLTSANYIVLNHADTNNIGKQENKILARSTNSKE